MANRMIAVYLYIIVKNERIKVKAWWSMGELPSFHVSPPLSTIASLHSRDNYNYPPRQQERLNKAHYAGVIYPCGPGFKCSIEHDLHF